MDQVYKLGAVGLGHWFDRLYIGMKKSNRITIEKAVGTSTLESKLPLLKKFNISAEGYYRADSNGHIPDEFYEDIDIVHISDPNQFHSLQMVEALERGKCAVVEKTLSTTKQEFDKAIAYVEKEHYENRLYLHLHYLHKLLTMELNDLIRKHIGNEGRISGISSSFLEEENDEDTRRSKWLFAPESGGLYMDWIHPFEIVMKGASADAVKLDSIKQYMLNEKYSAIYPTGIESRILVNGSYFSNDAEWISKVGKGVKNGLQRKTIAFTFESGAMLELNYKNSEMEFSSSIRGAWNFYDASHKIKESGTPSGPTASDLLVRDMIRLCEEREPLLKLADIKKIFEPQWDYQAMSKNSELIKNESEIKEFTGEK